MSHSIIGRPWNPDETEELARLYFIEVEKRDAWRPSYRGERQPEVDTAAIAAALGRTVKSVFSRISLMGMNHPGVRLRTCIGPKCRGERRFYSIGPGNRICGNCATSEMMMCA